MCIHRYVLSLYTDICIHAIHHTTHSHTPRMLNHTHMLSHPCTYTYTRYLVIWVLNTPLCRFLPWTTYMPNYSKYMTPMHTLHYSHMVHALIKGTQTQGHCPHMCPCLQAHAYTCTHTHTANVTTPNGYFCDSSSLSHSHSLLTSPISTRKRTYYIKHLWRKYKHYCVLHIGSVLTHRTLTVPLPASMYSSSSGYIHPLYGSCYICKCLHTCENILCSYNHHNRSIKCALC